MYMRRMVVISILLIFSNVIFCSPVAGSAARPGTCDIVASVEKKYYLMKRLEHAFALAAKQCEYLRNAVHLDANPDTLANLSPRDAALAREDILAVCRVYKEWLETIATKNENGRSLLTNITELYSKISELPIPELLFLLDQMTDQIAIILDSYEHDAKISWHDWLCEYWWVPPTILASVAIKVALVRIGLA